MAGPFLGMGFQELAIILLIVLVIFGPKQLPKLGKMFGKTMKEVRSGMEGLDESLNGEKADKVDESEVAEAPKKADEE